MAQSKHNYMPREIGFFVEAVLRPVSLALVEWADNGGAVEIYYTADPIQTIRGIANWTKFTKPGSSGIFVVPLGTRKIAIEATSVDAQSPSSVTVIMDGVSSMEQARVYGVDQLDSPIPVPVGAREWDGASWNRFTGVSGVSDGRLGTCSFWMNVPDATAPWQGNMLLAGGNGAEIGPQLTYDSVNNQINLLLKGVGSSQSRMIFISDKVIADQWQHVMMSWEHTFPIDSAAHMTMYIDGVQILTGGGDLIDQINIDEDLNYLTGSWTQGHVALGQGAPSNDLHGCLSEFYFNTDERVDLTIEANRLKFRTALGEAVNIGGDGSSITGSQPAFYAANGELNPNAGYVPDLPVVAGAVVDCADAPPKV